MTKFTFTMFPKATPKEPMVLNVDAPMTLDDVGERLASGFEDNVIIREEDCVTYIDRREFHTIIVKEAN